MHKIEDLKNLELDKIDFSNDNDRKNYVYLSSILEKQTKSYQKKILRKMAWLANKKEFRLNERAKRKNNFAKLNGKIIKRKKLKSNQPNSDAVNIVIDFSSFDLMTEQEAKKALKQFQRCYAINRRLTNPINLHASGVSQNVRSLLDEQNSVNWKVQLYEDHFMNHFPKSDIIYLTSDSENTLDTISGKRTYVIGGLVDHNRNKFHTYNQCLQMGINHAKLPLTQYLQMKTTKVLTIDHVFHILVNYVQNPDWTEAFISVLPKRKNIQVKEKTTNTNKQKDSDSKIDLSNAISTTTNNDEKNLI